MKILIVDDEALALDRLERMLLSLGYTEITRANTPEEALDLADEKFFDLVFLDINMPQINGIELGYEFRYQYKECAIIYQTAYEQHALKAFDIGAIGYLVKPYSTEQLKETITRVKTENNFNENLRIMSKSGENYYLLKPEEIFYIQADLSEVVLRSDKGFSYYAQKISDLETLLAPYQFARVHRSYLINLNKIKEIQTVEQSKLRFYFHGIGEFVDSSKDGAKFFRQRFSLGLGEKK